MAATSAVDGHGLAEYGCVSKLRRRRLITYLSLQGYPKSFAAYAVPGDMMDELFDATQLDRLVIEGRWEEALRYLLRFLPQHPAPMSLNAKVLYLLVQMHGVLAKIVAGKRDADTHRLASKFRYYRRLGHLTPADIKLRSIILAILHCDTRTVMDWGKVRTSAAECISSLADRTPELRRQVLRKRTAHMMPHHVLPIGFSVLKLTTPAPFFASFRQRRRLVKKQGRRPSKRALANAFEFIKDTRMLFPRNSEGPTIGHSTEATGLVADYLDQSFAFVTSRECDEQTLGYPLEWPSEQSDKGDKPRDLRVSMPLPLFGTTTPAKNFTVSALRNAGTANHDDGHDPERQRETVVFSKGNELCELPIMKTDWLGAI
uniref:Uncharacterized protein n=1 Tax=Leersia perrieri TaxID=77586 RepID=A0A0D9VBX7_9ORYZ